jgi:predicted Co/Zn/Cd cation transporter (cation efflux family)
MVTAAPDRTHLRHFGLIVGGIFAAIGLWPMVVRAQSPRLWVVALGVALVIPALLMPESLRLAYRGWMAVGEVLGWINTRVILGAVFFALITPIAVVMRAAGRDPLRRRVQPGATTYRLAREVRPASHMTRQF